MLSPQRGRRIVRPSVANGGTEWDPRRVGAGSSKLIVSQKVICTQLKYVLFAYRR